MCSVLPAFYKAQSKVSAASHTGTPRFQKRENPLTPLLTFLLSSMLTDHLQTAEDPVWHQESSSRVAGSCLPSHSATLDLLAEKPALTSEEIVAEIRKPLESYVGTGHSIRSRTAQYPMTMCRTTPTTTKPR